MTIKELIKELERMAQLMGTQDVEVSLFDIEGEREIDALTVAPSDEYVHIWFKDPHK